MMAALYRGAGARLRARRKSAAKVSSRDPQQRRIDALAASNQKLEREIVRRQSVEKSLKKSEQHRNLLLRRSLQKQEQLRKLSRQVLLAQEQERKRISRDLHDVIGQILTSINVRLTNLNRDVILDPKNFGRSIDHTQKLVEKAVNIVHRFARELHHRIGRRQRHND